MLKIDFTRKVIVIGIAGYRRGSVSGDELILLPGRHHLSIGYFRIISEYKHIRVYKHGSCMIYLNTKFLQGIFPSETR